MSELNWTIADVSAYGHLDALEVWEAVRSDGTRDWAAVRSTDESEAPWALYAILSVEEEGVSGLEHLSSFLNLDDAQEAAASAGQ